MTQRRNLERDPGYKPGMYIRQYATDKLRPVKLQAMRSNELPIEDEDTKVIPTISKTKKLLRIDDQGRVCLKKSASDRATLELCDELVDEYRMFSGEFPAEIVLSQYRYLTLDAVSKRFGRFCTRDGGVYIPYVCDKSISFPDFDVMGRGIMAWTL